MIAFTILSGIKALAAFILRLAAHVGAFIKHHRLDQKKTA